MKWKKRTSRSIGGGKNYINIIIIVIASRHGVSAMPWPSTDREMRKGKMMVIIGVNMEIVRYYYW